MFCQRRILLFPLAGLVLAAVGGWAALALAGGIIAFGAYRIFGMPGLLVLAYALSAGIALLTAIELRRLDQGIACGAGFRTVAGTLAITCCSRGYRKRPVWLHL